MNSHSSVNQLTTPVLSLPLQSDNGEIHYPTAEKKVMGETDYHYRQIELLMQMLTVFFESRQDVYVSSDIMFYYEEGKPRRFFAPDLMVCFGLDNRKRRTYKLWEEQVVPSVIIEIASDSTWRKDVTGKRRLYERLGVAEYYIFDPEYQYLPQPLIAYHAEFGELARLSINKKRVFSPALGLELVDTGEDLRLFDVQTKQFLPTINDFVEVKRDAEQAQAEVVRLKAEIARLKAVEE